MIRFVYMTIVVLSASLCLAGKASEEIGQGKTEFEKKYKGAGDALLTAFDNRINQARNAPKLSAAERQDVIRAIEAEKAIFEKHGHIPFSPVMRTDAIAYLNTIQKAEFAVGKIYDKAIDAQTKAGNDAAARELIEDKKITLAPKVVGKWAISDANGKSLFTWVLQSNGSTGKGTWTLDQQHLMKREPDANAPGGAWIDTATVNANGLDFKAKNNNGHPFGGKLIAE